MVEIKLLEKNYMSNIKLYEDFMNDSIDEKSDYYSEDYVTINENPFFPIYMGKGSEDKKKSDFEDAINIIYNNYIYNDRSIHLNGLFWHSFLMTKRNDIIKEYKDYINTKEDFYNVVLKPFDWENYIYKCIIAAEYIKDSNLSSKDEIYKYINLIINNLDIYNYLIKYDIFKNSQFVINFLTVIDNEDYSELFKSRIKNRPDLEVDPRYGRRVIFELNKNYPVVMTPLMDVNELTIEVKKALSKYI